MADDQQKRYDPMFAIAPSREAAMQSHFLGTAERAGQMFGPAAYGGAALAGAISDHMGRTKLPYELERRIKAQEAAQARFDSIDKNAMSRMEAGQKSRIFRRILAEEAFRNGLPEIGSQLFQQVQDESDEAEKRAADLERVGIMNDRDLVETEKNLFEHKRAVVEAIRGKATMIYPRGSSNPNSGVAAYIDDEGNAHISANEVLPLGGYSTARPSRPPQPKTGGKAGGGASGWTNSEKGSLRALMRDSQAQMRAGLGIKKVLMEAVNSQGTVDIMGKAGEVSSFVTKTVDELTALARTLAGSKGDKYSAGLTIEGSGSDGTLGFGKKRDVVLNGTMESALEYADRWGDGDRFVPENLRRNETQSRMYKAALINLTYAKARSQEPGNPRLSDDDFKRNLESMASGTTSPETMRRVLLDQIETSYQDFNIFLNQLPEGDVGEVINPRSLNDYEGAYNEFQTEFGQSWGTASHPGPGLRPAEPARKIDLGGGFSVELNGAQ